MQLSLNIVEVGNVVRIPDGRTGMVLATYQDPFGGTGYREFATPNHYDTAGILGKPPAGDIEHDDGTPVDEPHALVRSPATFWGWWPINELQYVAPVKLVGKGE